MLALITAFVTQADLVRATATIPTDQLILTAGVADAGFAIRAALLGAGSWCRAAGLAGDAALVAIAAVTIARAPGWAAGALQAKLGAGTTDAVAERCGAGAGAEDADPVSGATATVAVDATAV